ncbi:MAG: hypothetical protein GY790_08240 [Bacteroidetes bacterium]|nr:hypothetical protein [Bacteroidota bacterium]
MENTEISMAATPASAKILIQQHDNFPDCCPIGFPDTCLLKPTSHQQSAKNFKGLSDRLGRLIYELKVSRIDLELQEIHSWKKLIRKSETRE